MGDMRNIYKTLISSLERKIRLKERDYLVDIGVDKMIILKLIFKAVYVRMLTGLSWPRIKSNGGFL